MVVGGPRRRDQGPEWEVVRRRAHRDPAPGSPRFLCRSLRVTRCQILCVRGLQGMTMAGFQRWRQNDKEETNLAPYLVVEARARVQKSPGI